MERHLRFEAKIVSFGDKEIGAEIRLYCITD